MIEPRTTPRHAILWTLVAVCAALTGRVGAVEEGFTPLFNGKDLTGWSGDSRLWRVEGGEIIGSSDGVKLARNTFLSTEKKYGDFVLRVEAKLRNHNSGIQFRSDQHPDHVIKGYQADLAEATYTGMLYEEGKRGILDYWKKLTPDEQKAVFAAAKPLGEWNDFEITCKGHRIQIKLNGIQTLDLDDPDGAAEGVIALQLHAGPSMQVNFRNIRIKEIEPEDGFTPLFNGRDLTGWKGDPRLWKAEGGEIIGSTDGATIPHNSFLATERSFSDFTLKIEVNLRNHNSGVQFRSELHPDHVVKGYQADVAESTYSGMCYEEGKRGIMDYWKALSPERQKEIFAAAKPLGEWNEYEITCVGHHVTMKLNGSLVLDMEDPDGASEGVVALQLHSGPPMQVRFRNIRIKEHAKVVTKAASTAPRYAAEPLLPDQTQRKERSGHEKRRFIAPEGFEVVQVGDDKLTGSIVNMTFDHKGRPVLALENKGIVTAEDTDGDGVYDTVKPFSQGIKTAHGLHFTAPGVLLINANDLKGDTALFRLTDADGDGQAEKVERLMPSKGGIGEHGPHAILTGYDGYTYVLYGNHAYPDVTPDPASPSRGLQEDYLLPRYVDPRGHATKITAPGGVVMRVDLATGRWSQYCGGFRNAFDFALNPEGELFTFDSDMEWDVGLPWFREIRVVHCQAGGDYGWRTGSENLPSDSFDMLPPLEEVGRGSPVGVTFYDHGLYPAKYRGALFLGDWSRGRIRVSFPKRSGAGYTSKGTDFVLGEPLNVTDLAVGPDGCLWFSTGGRGTTGGLYKVTYAAGRLPATPTDPVEAILVQPEHRSAWGRAEIEARKAELGDKWKDLIIEAVTDNAMPPWQRTRALELMQLYGPAPGKELLTNLARDYQAVIRAAAVQLIGNLPAGDAQAPLMNALGDKDPLVIRRAAEGLVLSGAVETAPQTELAQRLVPLLDASDEQLAYAARNALTRISREAWAPLVLAQSMESHPKGTLRGLVALAHTAARPGDADAIFNKLGEISAMRMDDETLAAYARTVAVAFIRDPAKAAHDDFRRTAGPRLLAQYPSRTERTTRELATILAHMRTPGVIGKLLAQLDASTVQEDQIHIAYCLRAVTEGWTPEQRSKFVAWFDSAREMGGGASMEGYIEFMWKDTLALLPPDELKAAQARKAWQIGKRNMRARMLTAQVEGDKAPVKSDLSQMGFQELAEYLEFDPMSYEKGNVEKGRQVFHRAKCATCHIFGNEGKGGGPDLSNVVKRFRRREILEAIMYPSKVVSDQYQAYNIELKDGDTVSGFVADENEKTLTLINITGDRQEIAKDEIKERRLSQVSMMPEGLLDAMSQGDLVNLINFLEKGAGL